MLNRALSFSIALSLALAARGVSAQELPGYDALVKELTPKLEGLKSWTADVDVAMNMMGQEMTIKGSTVTRGKLTASDITMMMMGQPMQMKSVLGEDGIQWTDMNVFGERQVMKMEVSKMKDQMAGQGLEVPMGSDLMEDPSKILARYGNVYDMTVVAKEEFDGVPVYLVEGKLKKAGTATDPTALGGMLLMGEMMKGMGLSLETVKVRVASGDGFVRWMEIGNLDGKPWMTMAFRNVKTNVELADSLFQFTPPEGVPVMDLAEMASEETASGEIEMADGPQFEIGQEAPHFEGTNLEGKQVKLSEYRGKIVLVDFWATWCGPCVQELPNVIAAYEAHHAKGFEIIGVSLDSDRAKLTEFLKNHSEMKWVQLFDGKGWESGIGTQYGVNSIPFTLLLDREGKVAATDLRGQALSEAVAKLLGS